MAKGVPPPEKASKAGVANNIRIIAAILLEPEAEGQVVVVFAGGPCSLQIGPAEVVLTTSFPSSYDTHKLPTRLFGKCTHRHRTNTH